MPARSTSPRQGAVTRTPWGTITRDQIVDAALRAVRTRGGYERMTIRGLAGDMGVSPMSLYRHVRNKDDLLDEVVDRLLTRVWKPRTDPRDWQAWVAEAADRLRRFLVSQPAALHVYLTHPVVSPAAVARMDAMMAVLGEALGDDEAGQRAYAAIHTYTVGFSALEASRAGWSPPEATAEPALARDRARRQPDLSGNADLVRRLAAYTTPRQFAEGLRYLLAGIDRHKHADSTVA